MNFISQSGKNDCAYTCLAIMLSYYHKDKNYLYLKHIDRSYSFDELIKEGRKYGLTLLGVKINDEEELAKSKVFPFIATLYDKERKVRHAVLVLRANSKSVTFFDSEFGKRKMNMSMFLEKWTKMALIAEKVVKTPCPTPAPHFVAKKDKITLPILQILSGASLFTAGIFVNKDAYIFLPIAFTALFVIFELLFRENMIGACKRMDENINRIGVKEEATDYFDLYQDIEKYRYNAFTNYINVIYVFLLELMFTFILVINSPLNIIYIFLAVLLALTDVFILRPFYKKKEIEIIEEENKIKEATDSYTYEFHSKEARDKSYKLAQYKMVMNYVSIGLLLISIILVMGISQVVDVTYIVFYLCASIFLKGEFSKIFAYGENQKEFHTCKARIINRLK